MAESAVPSPPPDPSNPDGPSPVRAAAWPPSGVWWGSGETRTFAEDPAAFLLDGEPDLNVAGGATLDLRGPANTPPPVDPAANPGCRYRIVSEIGRGGMGVVLRAWDAQLGRDVAIKVLLEQHRERPEAIRRFVDEARITSQLHHHGIVPVHEFGTSPDGRPFFAMRLVQGDTLEDLLGERDSPLADLSRFLAVFLQVSQAVAHAHSQGVIHRDLKPRNVMVGAFGAVKVMDWGLAKVLAETGEESPWATAPPLLADGWSPPATQVGEVFGTPAYLPPEQAGGRLDQVDRRADVFGLGAILCEVLTGSPPYTGDDGRAVYDKAVAADLGEALARLDACPVPLDLVALAKWCLSPEPGRRPASAADVTEVLTAYLQADQRRAELDLIRFFDLSLDLFCIANTDGYFRRVNGNFAKLLGYPLEEFTDRPFVEFVHPDDRARTVAETGRLAGGEPSVRFANRYRHADGRYIWLEWNARTILEEQAIYAVARDVTERMAGPSPEPGSHRHRPGEFVSAAAAALTAGNDLTESLQAVAELTVQHLGVAVVRIWALVENAGMLELRASAGLPAEPDGLGARIAVGDGTIGRIAKDRKPLHADSVADQGWAARHGIAAFAGFPLTAGDRTLGVFAAFAHQPFAEEALDALRAVTSCLALRVWADADR